MAHAEHSQQVAVPKRISTRWPAILIPIVLMAFLLGLGALIVLNIGSAGETSSQTETVDTAPAVTESEPAQNLEPGMSAPATPIISLQEVDWVGVDLQIFTWDQMYLREEKEEWLRENVYPKIQRDPWFLKPGAKEGFPAGFVSLYADGNVWFASVIDLTCLQNCVRPADLVGTQRDIVTRFTYRLLASLDAGETWMEFVPPSQYHQDNLPLAGEGYTIGVRDNGETASFYIGIQEPGKGSVYREYQATIPKSPS
ncbi:hypothetical protein IH982_02085 [Patescibacteria group bacterium]|nr:hypothetical protein [Patescibacteria group bacterium]